MFRGISFGARTFLRLFLLGMVLSVSYLKDPIWPVVGFFWVFLAVELIYPLRLAHWMSCFFLHFVYVVWCLPEVPNHAYLMMGMDLVLGAAIIHAMLEKNPLEASAFQGELRWILGFLYLFAGFHKLNFDFFLSAHSCSGDLLSRFFQTIGFGPPSASLIFLSALFAVVTEIFGGILLIGNRKVKWVAFWLIAFHLLVGFRKVYDFTGSMVPVLLLIAFSEKDLERWLPKLSKQWPFFAWLFLPFAIFLIPFLRENYWFAKNGIFALAVALAYGSLTFYLYRKPTSQTVSPKVSHPWALGIALFWVILNGTAPYLGWKTIGTFSMFSNLQVEGSQNNHLVPGLSALKFFPLVDDEVKVVSVLDEPSIGRTRYGFKPGQYVVKSELDRRAYFWEKENQYPVQLILEKDGRTYFISQEEGLKNIPWIEPSWWKAKFLGFRPIVRRQDGSRRALCQW